MCAYTMITNMKINIIIIIIIIIMSFNFTQNSFPDDPIICYLYSAPVRKVYIDIPYC